MLASSIKHIMQSRRSSLILGLTVSMILVLFGPTPPFAPSAIQLATTATSTNAVSSNPKKPQICFVAPFFSATTGDFLESVQNIGELGIRLPGYRYIILTNDESLNSEDWEKVVVKLNRTKYRRVKTHVTFAKFAGHLADAAAASDMSNALALCDVVFVMDGVYVPVPDEVVWEDLALRVRQSKGGLVSQLKPYNKTIVELLQSLPGNNKDTQENVDRTLAWLRNQTSFREDIISHWTNFFGYDPTNLRFQNAVKDFWRYYSTEELTPRDQPLWSWIVESHDLQPSLVKCVEPEIKELSPYVQIFWEQNRAETGKPTPRRQPKLQHWSHEKVKGFRKDPLHKLTGLKTFDP